MSERLKIWDCKIGEVADRELPPGADSPMRKAVEEAFFLLTGVEPAFTFSGWGGELTEHERAVVENRVPHPQDLDLRSENAAMREALERIAEMPLDDDTLWDNHHPLLVPFAITIARQALSPPSTNEEGDTG